MSGILLSSENTKVITPNPCFGNSGLVGETDTEANNCNTRYKQNIG